MESSRRVIREKASQDRLPTITKSKASEPTEIVDTPITKWLREYENGDLEAFGKIWNRYRKPLLKLVRERYPNKSQRGYDAEDIVQDVFMKLGIAAKMGRTRTMDNRRRLFGYLMAIAVNQVADRLRIETAIKRNRGKVRGNSAVMGKDSVGKSPEFDGVFSSLPTPRPGRRNVKANNSRKVKRRTSAQKDSRSKVRDVISKTELAAYADGLVAGARTIALKLDNDGRQIMLLCAEGKPDDEIAKQLDLSKATVRRYMDQIDSLARTSEQSIDQDVTERVISAIKRRFS